MPRTRPTTMATQTNTISNRTRKHTTTNLPPTRNTSSNRQNAQTKRNETNLLRKQKQIEEKQMPTTQEDQILITQSYIEFQSKLQGKFVIGISNYKSITRAIELSKHLRKFDNPAVATLNIHTGVLKKI